MRKENGYMKRKAHDKQTKARGMNQSDSDEGEKARERKEVWRCSHPYSSDWRKNM